MAILSVFNFITLNGYYKGPGGDLSWHRHGEEEGEFSKESLGSGNKLLFGRITYEMMASYWPTPMAERDSPDVARGMNSAEKIVFSRTIKKPEWSNTKIIGDNIVAEVKKLKSASGNMTILGSGSIVSLLTDYNLIDQYSIMVDPVALGKGTPIFEGIKEKLDLKLTGVRKFKSGVVLLNYEKQ